MTLISAPAPIHAQTRLSAQGATPRIYAGGVQRTAILEEPGADAAQAPDELVGVVQDAEGQAVRDAQVGVPALARWTRSGPDGRFSLKGVAPDRRLILNIQKTGYQPESLALDVARAGRAPLRAFLRRTEGALVIDNALRHLGDNRYSSRSAGAANFQGSAGGSAIQLPFSTVGLPAARRPVFRIGAVLGLDTAAAHESGQSAVRAVSSPARLVLNGRQIGELTLNGHGQTFAVPPQALVVNGVNLLEIQTGRRLAWGAEVDFDDFEFMTITLSFQ